MPQIIIGIVGQAGAGKGTAAKMLGEHHNAVMFTFSDILGDILDRLFLDRSRDFLIKLSTALRETFGQDVLANTMEKQALNAPNEVVIVDGIRRMEDIEDLSRQPSFHLIEITAPDTVRFERLKARKEKVGESDMTWEEFLEMGQRETERTIASVAARAKYHIDNQKDFNHLKVQLDQLIKNIRGQL